jgi:hypothetical protein
MSSIPSARVENPAQAADKVGLRQGEKAQGLKPIDSTALIGMTKVMPFYKAFSTGFFIKLCRG